MKSHRILLAGLLAAACLSAQVPPTPAPAGRGAAPAPVLDPDQTVAVGAMEQAMNPLIAAVNSARQALTTASLALPRNDTDIAAKADAVAKADSALAAARAARFERIQSSANKLNRDQVASVVAQAGRGGGGGRGAATNPAGIGLDKAKEETARLVTATGLTTTLFAAEPMVVNPSNMDIDARGRIWVNEGANYRSLAYTREEGDRIMILEDTDRDGVADKQTVFYQDRTVNTALGIMVLDNKAIVSSSPYVFVLTDTDNDGVADRRQVLFEDTSTGNHDHDVHTFVFGPDGKLYFNFGNEIRELRRPVGGLMDVPLHGRIPEHSSETVIDIHGNAVKGDGHPYRQGMALRANLDGSDVEVLGWNFRNDFEIAVDSYGRLWQSDNDDDGNASVRIVNVMPHGNYGYTDELNGAAWRTAYTAAGSPVDQRSSFHWHQEDPGVSPNLLITGAGSPTGMTVYEGALLPAVFQNQVIHTDARPSAARSYVVTKAGAGFTARIENILTPAPGEDWYRPSDIAVAPDGAVFVADWNDSTVGGHAMADQILSTLTGRIYRIAPTGNRPTITPPNLTTAAGAVAALQSPNMATRYLAWTKLNSMQAAAEAELVRLWNTRPAAEHDQRMRARALFLLSQIKGSGQKYISQAIEDPNEDIRVAALHAAQSAGLDVIPLVRQVVRDPSALVRREAAIALYHNKSPAVPDLWAALARQHDGKDRWYLEALGIGADGRWDDILPAWQAATNNDVTSPGARDIIWRSRGTKTAGLVLSALAAPGSTPADRSRFLRTLDFVQGPERDAALLKLLAP